jgi:prevent-host-death family protein
MDNNERCISAGKFKTHCLRLMDEVAHRGVPIVVTKRGKPIVKLVPAEAPRPIDPFGCMAGTFEIVGDILAPLGGEWTADEENVFGRDP